jgi:tetratricopeptide (TPR) repeat protein
MPQGPLAGHIDLFECSAQMNRVLAIALLVLFAPDLAAAQYDAAKTRPAMQRIFADLREVLPLAADEGSFSDPKNHARIRKALRQLATDAGALDDHTRGFDPGARYIARSLSRDVRQALQRFDQGGYAAAEYSVLELSSTCVTCHSRLPSPGDSPVAKSFVDDAQIAALPVLDRARIQAATRRFDDALGSYEAALAAPGADVPELMRPLVDYLTLCVRVKGDTKRPVPVLRRFAARPDTWTKLRDDVATWIKDLESLGPAELDSESVDLARKLIARGRDEAEYPADRSGLIPYLAASRILNRVVALRRDAGPELAEAYYLLGSVEARIGASFWESPSDFYLEMAIRMSPGTDVGRRAYALLEEETVLGFTGSGGEHLPDEERARLEELRKLVEGARN